MTVKEELLQQIQEWRRQQDMIEDMIQEAHNRIDELEEQEVEAA